MGVTGLWRLIEPTGKPVPVETLENKVLAIDISIWLHQVVKGYQDARGASVPNAHLMGLFQRLCKLLYFRIKPIFVFDGAFPDLKKETIAKRQDNKLKYNSESARLKREILCLLSKKSAIGNILGKQLSPKKSYISDPALSTVEDDDLFKLPALPQNNEESESESEDESGSSGSFIDLHSMDIESDNFKNMPAKEKYDLLVELKETRKMNSWGKLHELPKKSDNFSDYQMKRLLKRRKVQECLEETEKEMGDSCMSFNELESLLNEEGIDTKIDALPTRRIASNNTTRFVFISDMKQALENAKKRLEDIQNKNKDTEVKPSCSKEIEPENKESNNEDELEEDLKKAIAMSLECGNESSTSVDISSKSEETLDSSMMLDSDYSDTDTEDCYDFEAPDMSSAKAYIMQYSDFTPKVIDNIVYSHRSIDKDKRKPKVKEILKELNEGQPVVADKVNLSSDDETCIPNENLNNTELSSNKDVSNKNNLITSLEDKLNSSQINECNKTQSSVDFVENTSQEVITILDSTVEDVNDQNVVQVSQDNESDSNDDDFEDVPEYNIDKAKSIQLDLKFEDAAPEDYIFADVFLPKEFKQQITKQPNQDSNDYNLNVVKIVDNLDDLKSNAATNINIGNRNSDNVTIEEIKTDAAVMNSNNLEDSILLHEKSIESEQNKEENFIESEQNIEEISGTKELTIPDKLILENSADLLNLTAETNEVSFKKPEAEVQNKNNIDNNIDALKEKLSVEELNAMADSLQKEESSIRHEKARIDRMGRNITEQMTKEVQELLQLFGIPYIVAPMEAEAQCAFLESVKLTDGTITDDSDIWLFGGKTVYKNFFNQKKHVLQFISERIEKSYNLSREQLILLALLVGSDYTTGIAGVGPVTALEILASFPYNKKHVASDAANQIRYSNLVTGLQEFKNWVKAGKRTDNTVLKKKLRNVQVTDDFPSVRVLQAYFEPNVEKSEDKFTWGEPDITVLRDYTKTKFGWSQSKLDEIITPVIKRMFERKSQKGINDYFKRKVEFNSLEDQMSKRVKAAVQKMCPEGNEISQIDEKKKSKLPRKRKINNEKKLNVIDETKDLIDNIASKQESSKTISKEKRVNKKQIIAVENVEATTSKIDIKIQKSDRYHEQIPQREKDRKHILENKLKAIEIFRKSKMDPRMKKSKRKTNLPKAEANLSESDTD